MSRILKRPMFRIGGSSNEGIMSNVVPKRAGYQQPEGPVSTEDNYQLDVNGSANINGILTVLKNNWILSSDGVLRIYFRFAI
jgi:hypothetical protein